MCLIRRFSGSKRNWNFSHRYYLLMAHSRPNSLRLIIGISKERLSHNIASKSSFLGTTWYFQEGTYSSRECYYWLNFENGRIVEIFSCRIQHNMPERLNNSIN